MNVASIYHDQKPTNEGSEDARQIQTWQPQPKGHTLDGLMIKICLMLVLRHGASLTGSPWPPNLQLNAWALGLTWFSSCSCIHLLNTSFKCL